MSGLHLNVDQAIRYGLLSMSGLHLNVDQSARFCCFTGKVLLHLSSPWESERAWRQITSGNCMVGKATRCNIARL